MCFSVHACSPYNIFRTFMVYTVYLDVADNIMTRDLTLSINILHVSLLALRQIV